VLVQFGTAASTMLGVRDMQTYKWLPLFIVARLRFTGLYLAILYCMSVDQRRRRAWRVTLLMVYQLNVKGFCLTSIDDLNHCKLDLRLTARHQKHRCYVSDLQKLAGHRSQLAVVLNSSNQHSAAPTASPKALSMLHPHSCCRSFRMSTRQRRQALSVQHPHSCCRSFRMSTRQRRQARSVQRSCHSSKTSPRKPRPLQFVQVVLPLPLHLLHLPSGEPTFHGT
jgi:hypothetical protein